GGGVTPKVEASLMESTLPQINCQGTVALALRLKRGRCGLARYFSNRIDTILRRIVLTNLRRNRLGGEASPNVYSLIRPKPSAFAIDRKSHRLRDDKLRVACLSSLLAAAPDIISLPCPCHPTGAAAEIHRA